MPSNTSQTVGTIRPWAIRRWCLLASLVIAGIAEIGFCVAAVAAYSSGNRQTGVLLLVAVGWILYYALIFGMAYGIAVIDQRGPLMDRFPAWYQALFPPSVRHLLNWGYSVSPNIVLIAFPIIAVAISAGLLWAATTGQLNP